MKTDELREKYLAFFQSKGHVRKPSDVLALRRRIENDPAVGAVVYVSKEEALQRLKEIAARRPELAIETVSTNPLPNSLEVKLRSAQETRRLSGLLREEIGRGVVYDLIDNPSVVDKLLTITSVLSIKLYIYK